MEGMRIAILIIFNRARCWRPGDGSRSHTSRTSSVLLSQGRSWSSTGKYFLWRVVRLRYSCVRPRTSVTVTRSERNWANDSRIFSTSDMRKPVLSARCRSPERPKCAGSSMKVSGPTFSESERIVGISSCKVWLTHSSIALSLISTLGLQSGTSPVNEIRPVKGVNTSRETWWAHRRMARRVSCERGKFSRKYAVSYGYPSIPSAVRRGKSGHPFPTEESPPVRGDRCLSRCGCRC
ncbi:hypothetical protein FBU31_003315 [Coemansia sp. 'formosensis']|nr:hypothetical protein FBU31_003315 [Coemansia sp. 'formosensis']